MADKYSVNSQDLKLANFENNDPKANTSMSTNDSADYNVPSQEGVVASYHTLRTSSVVSDDDSLIQELESTPIPSAKIAPSNMPSLLGVASSDSLLQNSTSFSSAPGKESLKVNPTAESRQSQPPTLSPNEELTLLAVKNKPNSPDRDNDGAPSPPRKTHKHAAVREKPLFFHGSDTSGEDTSYDGSSGVGRAAGAPLNHRSENANAHNNNGSGHTRNIMTKESSSLAPMAANTFMQASNTEKHPLAMVSSLHRPTPVLTSSNSQGTSVDHIDPRDLPRESILPTSSQESYTIDHTGTVSTRDSASNDTSTRADYLNVRTGSSASSNSAPLSQLGRAAVKYPPAVSDSRSLQSQSQVGINLSISADEPSDASETLPNYAANLLHPHTQKQPPPSHFRDTTSPMHGSAASSVNSASSYSYAGDLDIAPSSSNDQGPDDSSFAPTPFDMHNGGLASEMANRHHHHQQQQHIQRAPSSHLVVEAERYTDDATRREVLRREAIREAEARLMAAAVNVNPKVMDEHEGGGFNWKLYCCIGCLLIIAVVAASVIFAIRDDDEVAPAPSPEVPTTNDECDRALQLVDFNGGTTQGEILLNVKGSLEDTCQVADANGFALWYYVEGNGNRLSASTCEGTDMNDNSDTQVLVFSGSCQELECIGGADQLCGSHGAVIWEATNGTRYYVVVKGYRTSNTGGFTLTLDTLNENGNCEVATEVVLRDSPVFGSTRDFSIDAASPVCPGTIVVSPEAWFTIEGNSSLVCAHVTSDESEQPDFPVEMSIFEGNNCTGLTCITSVSSSSEDSLTDSAAFFAESGSTYHVSIRGENADSQGEFALHLHEAPSNGICERAQIVPINSAVSATTVDGCNVDVSGCPGLLDHPGVWYLVEGTGELLVAQANGLTCEKDSVLQSQIFVFVAGDGSSTSLSSGCTNPICFDYTALACTAGNQKVTSQWFSNKGEFYYLFVQSADQQDFELSINEFIPGGSDTCVNATTVESTGESTLGSTVGANPASLGTCPNSGAAGVWYLVQGTGGMLEASTCNTGTNYSTGITILGGECGNFHCIETTTVTCDGERTIAYWNTTFGHSYSVYVHGQEETDTGRFLLTVESGDLHVSNDFCGTAEELQIPSTTVGSTVLASDNDAKDLCGNAATAPGVWYTVVGEGGMLTASLCSQQTQYDSQIYIFSGESCGEMSCITFNDDACGSRSRVSWETEVNVRYYILVSGFNNAVGDFELIVS